MSSNLRSNPKEINTPTNHASPRLSCRLLLVLYGENAYLPGGPEDLKKRSITLQHLSHKNNHDSSKDNKSSELLAFDVSLFLPSDNTTSDYNQRVQKIKSTFMSFIEEVNLVCDSRNSAPQKNAAKTMYRIISRNESMENSHKDVNSYFGFVNNTTFNKLVSLVNTWPKI